MKKFVLVLFVLAAVTAPIMAQDDADFGSADDAMPAAVAQDITDFDLTDADAAAPVIAAPVSAQNSAKRQERERKMFATISFVDKIMGENFPGGALSFGYHASPKSLFTAEIAAGFYNSGRIGSYYYGPKSDPHRYKDGKITYDYTYIEFIASWYYVGNISNKLKFRAGPSIGFITLTGKDSYDPTEKNGVKIDIPDSTSETKVAAAAGAGAGLIWNFHKMFFFDFGCRVLANSGLDFEEQTLKVLGTDLTVKEQKFGNFESQFNLTFGFRF
ncbi:MAG: hypothetical protein FWH43_05195 [Endomicrobia bacterium]|nr:hypothetical protein [Endomicrobiia bacterium]